MFLRSRGKAGEYIWEKEKERLDRYKDRPWELQSRTQTGSPFIITVVVLLTVVGVLALAAFV